MIALMIGIFTGFFCFFLFDQSIPFIAYCVKKEGVSQGLRASLGLILSQIVWILAALLFVGFISKYLTTGHHINSVTGFNRSFTVLSALIIGFSSYRQITKFPTIQQEIPIVNFKFFLNFGLKNPLRILFYIAFFGLFKLHAVTQNGISFLSLGLGTLFGTFLWWALFCNLVDTYKKLSLVRLSHYASYFMLALTFFALIWSA